MFDTIPEIGGILVFFWAIIAALVQIAFLVVWIVATIAGARRDRLVIGQRSNAWHQQQRCLHRLRRRDFGSMIVRESSCDGLFPKAAEHRRTLECDTVLLSLSPRAARAIDYLPITIHHSLAKAFGVHLSQNAGVVQW